MSLLTRSLAPLPSLLSDVYDMENVFPNLLPDWRLSNLPSVNIREEDDSYQVELAAPGLSKKDFNIDIDNNVLRISAEKKEEKEEKEKRYSRREYNYTSFSRSFTLPETINEDAIFAEYKEGVLCISVPKKEVVKKSPAKHIDISGN